jgi:hypothetical protein
MNGISFWMLIVGVVIFVNKGLHHKEGMIKLIINIYMNMHHAICWKYLYNYQKKSISR